MPTASVKQRANANDDTHRDGNMTAALGENFDLFGAFDDTLVAARSSPSLAAPAHGGEKPSPDPVTSTTFDPTPATLALLETIMPSKIAWKALRDSEPRFREAIAAVEYVAAAKAERYAAAHAGARVDSLGWVHREPELAQNMRMLASLMIDTNMIPMRA